MKFTAILLFLITGANMLFAQTYTISGYVSDTTSGEHLINATVYLPDSRQGAVTNDYGYYSISAPAGDIRIRYSYVGYQTRHVTFNLQSDTVINMALPPTGELETVEVTADRSKEKVRSTQISVNELKTRTIKELPVLLGEVDVLKTIQLMPGVQSGNEGTSGIYVRGGGPDQNLVLLDGVPVYNVDHLFGFFSVFNADAISNIKLIKGGFPARYGGRLSSVLDIRMKEGNMKSFHGHGSIGIISSKLTLEGPIIKDKTSFMVSGRRTYLDVLARPLISFINNQENNSDAVGGYFFHDINAKVNHKFSNKDRVYLSFYTGKDKAYFTIDEKYEEESYSNDFDLHWGNIIASARWNHLFSNKLFSNTTATFSRFSFVNDISSKFSSRTSDASNKFQFRYDSGIDDYALKTDFHYTPTNKHHIRMGAGYTYHEFNPGVSAFHASTSGTGASFTIDTTFGNQRIQANEFNIYAEDDWKITERIKINAGLRYTAFFEDEQFYHALQPRISARYLISENLSAKAAYTEMYQLLHLLTNNTIGLPTDIWLPSTENIPPQKARQFAAGIAYNISEQFDLSVEGYTKTMSHLISYKEGASFLNISQDWQDKVETGHGWSYGGEIMLEKTSGKLTGWLGYTLSRTMREFENINFGRPYPYRYDRRHDIGIALTYHFSDNFTMGATWVYGTGNAVTLAYEKFNSGLMHNYSRYIEYYESRNNYRMEPYHRLDVSINKSKEKGWGTRTWSLGVYNAYNRKNPFFMMFSQNAENTELKKYSLFPLLPAISYRFTF